MSIAEALREAIREEMRRDRRVFCIGEDIGVPGGFGGAFTVTLGLSDEFGHERMLDTPDLRDWDWPGSRSGAAMAGLRPIADVQYGDFLFWRWTRWSTRSPRCATCRAASSRCRW